MMIEGIYWRLQLIPPESAPHPTFGNDLRHLADKWLPFHRPKAVDGKGTTSSALYKQKRGPLGPLFCEQPTS